MGCFVHASCQRENLEHGATLVVESLIDGLYAHLPVPQREIRPHKADPHWLSSVEHNSPHFRHDIIIIEVFLGSFSGIGTHCESPFPIGQQVLYTVG